MALLVAVGCATALEATVRTDRTVLKSEPTVVESDGPTVARDVRWHGDRLAASLQRDRVCQEMVRDLVSYQEVHERKTRGVALDVVGGVVLALGGGALVAVSPGLSGEADTDPNTGEKKLSPRGAAMGGGVLLAIAGLALVGNGAVVAMKGYEAPKGAPRRVEEDREHGRKTACGRGDPPPGELWFEYAGAVVHRTPLNSSRVEVDLRRDAGDVCAQERWLGTPLRVAFAPAGGGERSELATHEADACVRATLARRLLAESEEGLGRVTGSDDIHRIVPAVVRAAALVAALPRGDPDEADLTKRVSQVRLGTEAAAARVLDDSLRRYAQVLREEDLDRAVPAALETLNLSRLATARRAQVFPFVYGALARAAANLGPAALGPVWRLLETDETARKCVADAQKCPVWLARADIVTALRPLGDRLRTEALEAFASLARARAGLQRKVTDSSAETAAGALHLASRVKAWCATPQWDDSVDVACQELSRLVATTQSFMEKHREALRKVRVARTAAAWRRNFPVCRKVAAAMEQFRAVTSCDEACQRIRERIEADWARLRDFTVEDGELDETARRALKAQCTEAQCPTCPASESGAAPASGVVPIPAGQLVIFEQGFPEEIKPVVLQMAGAIRAGHPSALADLVKAGETAGDLIEFWSGWSALSELRFRASYDRESGMFTLAEASSGMNTCEGSREGGRWVLGGCIFNDGL